MDGFLSRSKEIENNDFIVENYDKYATEKINMYLNSLRKKSIFNKLFFKINSDFFIKMLYDKKTLAKILNNIECEAHCELFISGLKSKINK